MTGFILSNEPMVDAALLVVGRSEKWVAGRFQDLHFLNVVGLLPQGGVPFSRPGAAHNAPLFAFHTVFNF